MDVVSFPSALQPLLEWTGILGADGTLDTGWVDRPPRDLFTPAKVAKLIEALGAIFGLPTGAPGASVEVGDARWVLLYEHRDSVPHVGVYLVLEQRADTTIIGVGFRVTESELTISANVPLLSTNGTADGTHELARPDGAATIAAEIALGSIPDLPLDAVRARVDVNLTTGKTRLALELLGLNLPGLPDRVVLGDDADATIWQALAGGLLAQKLPDLQKVLGLASSLPPFSSSLPPFSWPDLMARGGPAWIEWLGKVATSEDARNELNAAVKGLTGLEASLDPAGFAPRLSKATAVVGGQSTVLEIVPCAIDLKGGGARVLEAVRLVRVLDTTAQSFDITNSNGVKSGVLTVKGARFGIGASRTAFAPVVELEGVRFKPESPTAAPQTWERLDLTNTDLLVDFGAVVAGVSPLVTKLGGGVVGKLLKAALEVAFAADPLRALACVWKDAGWVYGVLKEIGFTPPATSATDPATFTIFKAPEIDVRIEVTAGQKLGVALALDVKAKAGSVDIALATKAHLLELDVGALCDNGVLVPPKLVWCVTGSFLASDGAGFAIVGPPVEVTVTKLGVSVDWLRGSIPIPKLVVDGLRVKLMLSAAGGGANTVETDAAMPTSIKRDEPRKTSWGGVGVGPDRTKSSWGFDDSAGGATTNNPKAFSALLGTALRRGGPWGFACALGLGLLPDGGLLEGPGFGGVGGIGGVNAGGTLKWSWPALAGLSWPASMPGGWPIDWPRFDPLKHFPADPNAWSTLLTNPLGALRAWVASLVTTPLHAKALLWLLGSATSGRLPDARRAFDGLEFDAASGALAFGAAVGGPKLGIIVDGNGIHPDPWRVRLAEPTLRPLHLLTWAEPQPDPNAKAVGLGFELMTPSVTSGSVKLTSRQRIDVHRITWGALAANAPPVPSLTWTLGLEPAKAGDLLVDEPLVKVTSCTFGARLSLNADESVRIDPILALDGELLAPGLELPLGWRARLEALFRRLTVEAPAQGALVLGRVLASIGLAIPQNGGYGLHPNALEAWVLDGDSLTRTRFAAAWASPSARTELCSALAPALGAKSENLFSAPASEPPTRGAARSLAVATGAARTSDGAWHLDPLGIVGLLAKPGAIKVVSAGARDPIRAAFELALGGTGSQAIGGGFAIAFDGRNAELSWGGPLGVDLELRVIVRLDTTDGTVSVIATADTRSVGVRVTWADWADKTIDVQVRVGDHTFDPADADALLLAIIEEALSTVASLGLEALAKASDVAANVASALGWIERGADAVWRTTESGMRALRTAANPKPSWDAMVALAGSKLAAAERLVAAIAPNVPGVVGAGLKLKRAPLEVGARLRVGAGDVLEPELTFTVSEKVAGKDAFITATVAQAQSTLEVLAPDLGVIRLLPFQPNQALAAVAAGVTTKLLPVVLEKIGSVPALGDVINGLGLTTQTALDQLKQGVLPYVHGRLQDAAAMKKLIAALTLDPTIFEAALGPLPGGDVGISFKVKLDETSFPVVGEVTGTVRVSPVAVTAELDFGLGVKVLPDAAAPRPSVSVKLTSAGNVEVSLRPFGDTSPFAIALVPNVAVTPQGTALAEAILQGVLALVAPLLVQAIVLPNPLILGSRLGKALEGAGVIKEGAAVFEDHLWAPLPEDPQDVASIIVKRVAGGLLGIIGKVTWQLSDFLTIDANGGALSVTLAKEVKLSDGPPRIDLLLSDDVGVALGYPRGLGVKLIKDSTLKPEIDLMLGLRVSGTAGKPAFDLGLFRIGTLGAWGGVKIAFPDLLATPQALTTVTPIVRGQLLDVEIPLGAASSVLTTLGGDGNDRRQDRALPTVSLDVGWYDGPKIKAEGEFSIQRAFGPIYIGTIRLAASNKQIAIGLDASATMSGLSLALQDLGIIIDLAPFKLSGKLGGIGVSYSGSGVRISGRLLMRDDDYIGQVVVEVAGYGLGAIGGFSSKGYTSLFVFLAVLVPIGGPPFFFVTGVAAGFGYNRSLLVPPVDGLDSFPLLTVLGNAPTAPQAELEALEALGKSFPRKKDSLWFAAGVRWTTFVVVRGRAVLYILIDDGFELGIVGIAQMQLPDESAPVLSIELLLKVRFSTKEMLLAVEARLSDNSWLLSPDCRLTGGFAFYFWFGGDHGGDFVISIGGYHPRFAAPTHYPTVPRIGLCWQPCREVAVKGEFYFTLCSTAVMFGGLIEASYTSGSLSAWLRVWIDALVSWAPFHYDFEVGLSLGAALGALRIELGARIRVWGPEFSAEVCVHIFFFDVCIAFGGKATQELPPPIEFDEFVALLPAGDDGQLLKVNVDSGRLPERDTGSNRKDELVRVNAEFSLRLETAFATRWTEAGLQRDDSGFSIDHAPMHLRDVDSTLKAIITDASGNLTVKQGVIIAEVTQVPISLWQFRGPGNPEEPSADTMSAVRGARLIFEVEEPEFYGSYNPSSDAEKTIRERWNLLVAAAPPNPQIIRRLQPLGAAERLLAHIRPVARRRADPPLAVAPARPVRARPLAIATATIEHGPLSPTLESGLHERVHRAETIAANEMRIITSPPEGTLLRLFEAARVVQLDRRGDVLTDKLVLGALSTAKNTHTVAVSAPRARIHPDGSWSVGWERSTMLNRIRPHVLLGPGAVVICETIVQSLGRLTPRMVAPPVPGSVLATQRQIRTELRLLAPRPSRGSPRPRNTALNTLGMLVEWCGHGAPDGLMNELSWQIDPVGRGAFRKPSQVVIDGVRVLLLWRLDGGTTSARLSVKTSRRWEVQAVVAWTRTIDVVVDEQTRNGLASLLGAEPPEATRVIPFAVRRS